MKKLFSSKLAFIISLIVFVVFNALFFIIAGSTGALKHMKAGMWVSFAFLEVTFIIICCMTLFLKAKSGSSVTALIPVYSIFGGYVVISFVANLIMLFATGKLWQIPLIINILIHAAFFILFFIKVRYLSSVNAKTEHKNAKVQELRQTTIKVNSLIYLAKDEEVKKAIRKLKETLDYSSPMSTPECAEYEQQLAEMIDTLKTLLSTDSDSETILSAVAEAENVLRIRNQMLMATRR